MRSKESIIRILAALRAKFAEGSGCTDSEAATALEQYNKLKTEYDIQETDIHIKQEGIGKSTYQARKTGKQKPDLYYLGRAISRLSGARLLYGNQSGKFHIYGTGIDREYAEFLLTVANNTIESSWKAYRYSYDYTRQVKHGNVHGRQVRNAFRKVVTLRLAERMIALAEANAHKAQVNALVVVKNELIQAFIDNDEALGNKRKGTDLTLKTDLHSTVHSALTAAEKAQLQFQATNETLLLEQKEESTNVSL
jgi:hypothetical protein